MCPDVECSISLNESQMPWAKPREYFTHTNARDKSTKCDMYYHHNSSVFVSGTVSVPSIEKSFVIKKKARRENEKGNYATKYQLAEIRRIQLQPTSHTGLHAKCHLRSQPLCAVAPPLFCFLKIRRR